MANMFDDARKRLKEKNDAVKVRSSANVYSSGDMFADARKRLQEKQTTQTSQSKVEIPQVSAGSVADLLPKPTDEADRRNYAAQMQQKTPAGLTESEFNRSSAMQEKYGSYRNYLNSSKLENLKKSSYGEPNTPRIDTAKVSHSSGTFENVDSIKPLQRIWNTVKKTFTGGAKNYIGSNVNAQGTAYDAGQNARSGYYNDTMAQYQKELDAATQRQNYMKQHIADGKFTQADVDVEQNVIDYYAMMLGAYNTGLEAQKGAAKETYKLADKVTENAAKDIQSAKDTSYGGKFGEMLVDAGASTVQSTLDTLSSMALTGYNPLENFAGSGKTLTDVVRANAEHATNTMIPFVVRSFGSGAQKARQEMEANGTADSTGALTRQIAYGIAEAAKEWATEKAGGIGANKIIGGQGYLDKLWDSVGDAVAQKLVRSPYGQQILSSFVSAFTSEAAEEVGGNWIDYLLSLTNIYGGNDASLINDIKNGNVDGLADTIVSSLEDGFVGGLSGLMGETASTAANIVENSPAAQRAYVNNTQKKAKSTAENFYQQAAQNGLFSTQATQAQRKASDANIRARQTLAEAQGANPEATRKTNAAIINALNNAQRTYTDTVELDTPATQSEVPYTDMGRFRNTAAAAEETGGNTVVPRGNNTGTAGTQSMNGNIILPTASQNGRLPTYAEMQNRGKMEENKASAKERQFAIIQNSNPMTDDQHTGIRSASEILTYDEATADYDGDNITPDYTAAMVQKAKETGEITVYSSKPIENGGFVTPSKMEAQNYAGDGKVYSATVKTSDIAWIDEIEGQYAKEVNNGREQSIGGERWQRSMAARAEVKPRLEALANTENRDIINGMPQQAGAESAAPDAQNTNRFTAVSNAAEEVASNGERGDVSVYEGGQRTYGQSTGERAGSVAETAGGTESEGRVSGEDSASAGRTQRTSFTETEGTAKITSVADAKDKSIGDLSFGEEVDSTKYFGKSGSTATKFREVIGGETEKTREAKKLAKDAGADLILVAGDDISYANGKRSRAVIRRVDGKKTIVARVDDSDADVVQLVQHELGHDKIRDGKLNVSKAVERFRRSFVLGEEEADNLIDTYIRIKFGDDAIDNATEAERQQAITELVCDTFGDIDELAGIPALKAWSDGFQALKRAVQESMSDSAVQTGNSAKSGENVSVGADMERSNAPPKVVNGIAVAPDVAKVMESEEYSAPADYMNLSKRSNKKIAVGMTDSERADILREKTIPEVTYDGSADPAISENQGNLESMSRTVVSKTINRLKENFDIPKEITNDDYQMVVTTASGVFSESVSKEITDVKQLVKLMPIISRVVESAVGIESHSNRYYYDNNTVLFHNMIGGYVDGDSFVPIRFGVKQSVDGNNYLYVVIDNEAIKKAEVMRRHTYDNHRPDTDYSATFNVADILSKVNSKEILKYVPDEFLDEERKSAKYQAIAETIKKTNDKNDEKYAKFISEGKLDAAMRMVFAAAKAHGYTIRAWHGSRNVFRSFSKNKLGSSTNTESSKRWFFAADEETANSYYPRGVMEQLVKQGMFSQKDLDSMDKRGVSGKLYSLFIKMENPLEVDVAGYDYAAHREKADAMVEYLEQAERNNNDGIILYNVRDNNLKPDEENSTDYLFREPSQAKLADVITYDEDGNIVPISQRFNEDEADMNMSSRSISSEIRNLQNENKRLQTRLDEAKRQTTLTTTPTFTDRTIARAANNLIRMVGSDTKAEEIKPRIKEFFEYMANDPTNEGMQERAYDIASDLVDNAKEMVGDDVDIYNRMAGYLKDNKLFLSKEYRSDVNYKEFVKNNPKVKMSSNGVPVDVAYQELQEIFGEGFFPPDVIHPADQLEQIADVLDSLKPFYRNPYSLEMALAYNWTANAVIDEYFDAKEAPATYADKAVKKLEAQANKYEQKLITQQANYEDALTKQEADYEAKLARQKENLTANYEDRLTKQEADYEAEIERRRQNAAFMVQAAVAKEKRLRDKKISALKEHYQSVNERKRELKQERNDREKLRKIVKRLQSNKIDPVTKSMLPAIVRELDATAVNLTDKSVEKLSDLRQWYEKKTTEGSDIYDPNFIPDKATIAKLKRLEAAMNGKTIGQMTILEVRELTEVLQNIEYQMHEGKNFQQSKVKKDNYEAGLRTIQDIENARPGKINRELSPQRAARRIAGYNDGAIEGTEASPLITLMDETVEGERKADLYQRDALHVFKKWLDDKDFMRGLYGRKAKEIMITGVDSRTGETRNVAITPAMRISLYLHSMNDDNMRHIQEGGVVIPAMNLYKKGKAAEAYAADIRVKLTKTNVAKICDGMSEMEKRFAKTVYWYFNEYAPKRLNEASVLIDGYEKFNVENYFPISVDSNFLSQDYESVIMDKDGSLTHPGFGEERIQSTDPIYLRDVNDVFMTAVRTNSMYACQAVPLMNLSKLINVQQVGAVDSVSAALNRKYVAAKKNGDLKIKGLEGVTVSAYEYLSKYMRDYAGNKSRSKGFEKIFSKYRSNYSGGVLTLAAGTAIKQAASYPTAAAVTSTRSLIQALNPARTVNTSFIDERTAAFTKRTEGLSTLELAEMTQEGKHIPRPLNWIQFIDVTTTNALKRAAAIEIQRTTNLKLGTEEYEKAVTDLYIKIIEETQPNYSIALRPDILRSDSALERAIVMFATQPMQNFGILYDALGDYQAKRRAYTANKSKATESAVKASREKLGKAIGSQLTSSLVFSIMQFAYDAFRKKKDKYEDENGYSFIEYIKDVILGRTDFSTEELLSAAAANAKGIGINMLSNGAGMLIAGKVALEAAETLSDKVMRSLDKEPMFNASIYGFDVAEFEAFGAALASAIAAIGETANAAKLILDGEKETIPNYEKLARKVYTAAEDILLLRGVALENATTTITSIAKHICTTAMGKYVGGYYALRISTNPDDSKKPFYDLLWDSIQKGTKSDEQELIDIMLEDGFDRKKIQEDINGRYYDKIWENRNNYNEMMRWYREAISHGAEEGNIRSSMESRMKKDEGVNSVTELKKRWDDIIK